MAKNTNSNKGNGKMLLIVLALLLVVAFIAISIWQGTANFARWFPKQEQQQTGSGGELNSGDSGLIAPEEHEANGVSFKAMSIPVAQYNDYGVSALAETAVQLTVKVEVENPDLSDGKFTIAFKNASSTWAKGKTLSQYVTLSQSDSTHATVSCLKAFGEQIVVTYTVTGEDNKKVTATYPFDYAKRILSIEWYTGNNRVNIPVLLSEEGDSWLKFNELKSQSGSGTLTGHFTYSDYTVDDTFSISTIESELDRDGYLAIIQDATWNPTTFAKGSGSNIQVNYDSIKNSFGMSASGGLSEKVKNALQATTSIKVSMTLSGTHSTYSTTYTCENFGVETLPTLVPSVQIQDGNGKTDGTIF